MATAGPAAEPTAELKGALDTSRMDACVLLWFASREGKKVADRVLSNIVSAESELREGKRTPKVEGTFWAAYRELAAAVKPASVESILSTCQHPFKNYGRSSKLKLGNARNTKQWYTIAAVVVLVIILSLQTYWFIVTTFSTSMEKNHDETDSIAGALRVMNVLARQEDPKFANKSQLDDLIRDDRQRLLQNWPIVRELMKTQEPEQQIMSILTLDLRNKSYRRQRLQSMIENEMAVLQEPWKVISYLFIDYSNGAASAKSPGSDPALPRDQEYSVEQPAEAYDQAQREFQALLKAEEAEIVTASVQGRLEQLLSQSKSAPAILSQYFLPMLYGLLGSLTYILRSISGEIQEVTFTRGSATRYSLRWPLGMLAGVTISLFFDPAYFSGLAAITPLGVAFLAGYGVELFFTGLDGLVRAFTGEGPERKTEAA